MRRAACAAAAVLVGWLGAAGAVGAAPALWLVKDADSEVYLFGTLHALNPASDWRTPLYDAAYARAQTVWFEADLEQADPAVVQDLLDRYGADRRRSLRKKLARRDLQALASQVDLARIEHLRPWAAALMLSMQPTLELGATVEAGADLTITRVARQEAKRIRTFETLEDQARMFASLPEPAEVRYLTGVIRERAGRPRLPVGDPGPSLEEAWLAGDLERLAPELVGGMKADNPAFYDALLRRRNLAWAETLVGVMAGSGVDLVNVGALHMVGEEGLPALLAARGFTVERIQ